MYRCVNRYRGLGAGANGLFQVWLGTQVLEQAQVECYRYAQVLGTGPSTALHESITFIALCSMFTYLWFVMQDAIQ